MIKHYPLIFCTQAVRIRSDFCAGLSNFYIWGKAFPVIGTPKLIYHDTSISSLAIVSIGNDIVAAVGTSTGFVNMVCISSLNDKILICNLH